MKAIINEFISLETEDDLENYKPADPLNFSTWIRLAIGPENEKGSDFFDLLICTPSWIKAQCDENKSLQRRHMMMVAEYDYLKIKSELIRQIDNCSGENWASIAKKIAKFAAWEFEDYK